VAAVIAAQSDAHLRAARRLQEGRLAAEVQTMRDELAALLALVEAGIDFVDEPIEFITADETMRRLLRIDADLQSWIMQGHTVEALSVLPQVLLLGPPNAGKSSLLNCLSGTPRAICAAVAGTTRDILSVPVSLQPGDAVLLDSAGIDAAPDEILVQARKAALREARQVELVCLVIDMSVENESFLQEAAHWVSGPAVLAANKTDRLRTEEVAQRVEKLRAAHRWPVVPVSALHGAGMSELRRALADALNIRGETGSGGFIFNERQRASVLAAVQSVARARALLRDRADVAANAELLAFELREGLDSLGGISGEVSTEELLGQVFSRFCIGK
jgi:tRNA modification GTPase